MPTLTLHLSSLYENIFETTPNYSKLKIFGCLYYPWLRPYTSHKLESHSKPSVFLRYSFTQSAYYCLDPSTSKIYVSRHVKFVETLFPFTNLSQQLPCAQSTSITTWIPPPIHVSISPHQEPLNSSSAVHGPQQLPTKFHH